MELGEIAYNAWAEALGWKLSDGERMQPFEYQSARLQDAWQAAGEAVQEYLETT
jgi:hypothetical protein